MPSVASHSVDRLLARRERFRRGVLVAARGLDNEGRGTAEKVRFQVKLPPALAVAYDEEPDFKVYKPESVSLEKNEFYTELGHFPSGAKDFLALRIEGDAGLLCDERVKFVNDDFEGEVGDIKGVEGCK